MNQSIFSPLEVVTVCKEIARCETTNDEFPLGHSTALTGQVAHQLDSSTFQAISHIFSAFVWPLMTYTWLFTSEDIISILKRKPETTKSPSEFSRFTCEI